MTMDTFTKGQRVYTSSGEEVEYRSLVGDGRHVVAPVIIVCDPNNKENEWEEICDETIVREVFDVPPSAKRNEEIDRLDQEIGDKRQQLRNLTDELRQADATKAELMSRLSQIEALRDIELYMAGKFTHVVTARKILSNGIPQDVEVELFAEGCRERSFDRGKEIAMLCLFGRSDRRLTWRLNDYKDGSGEWRLVVPCVSEEDAKQKAGEMIRDGLQRMIEKNHGDYDLLKSLTDSAKKIGFKVEEKFLTARRDWELRFGAEQLKKLEAQISDVRQKYIAPHEQAETAPDWVTPTA
jgi:hypothetical protein